MVEAKAKARRRREEGIRRYQLWLQEHPRAKRYRRIEMFDLFVDNPNYIPRKKKIEHLPRT